MASSGAKDSLLTQSIKLRNDVFRATENHATPASQPSTIANPLVRPVLVYVLSAEHAKDIKVLQAFHLYLIVCGTGRSTDRYEWANYIATLASACLPAMRGGLLSHPQNKEHVLGEADIKKLLQWFNLYRGAVLNMAARTDETEEEKNTREKDAKTAYELAKRSLLRLELPHGSLTPDINFQDVLDIPSIYGHFSLVLFLGGKNITDKNRTAISQNRPGAIEGKYYNKKVVASLSGALKLSNESHTWIHAAFVTIATVRKPIFTVVVTLTAASTLAPEEDVIATTTRLMRFGGMQQAMIIDEFLAGHEEAFQVPFLIPSIRAYNASTAILASAPAEQRPFYKILHGDATRAFNRNDILPLLAVALVYARELNPTLLQYEIPSNHQLVMEKYQQTLRALAADDDEE